MSPDNKLLAWNEDTVGGEKFDLHVKDIATGRELMEPIRDTGGEVMWANDNAHIVSCTIHLYVCPRVCVLLERAGGGLLVALGAEGLRSAEALSTRAAPAVLCAQGQAGPPLQGHAPQVSARAHARRGVLLPLRSSAGAQRATLHHQ